MLKHKHSTSKKTLVLIHGFLCFSSIWETFTASFEDEFSVYLVNLPGHTGESSANLSIKELADAIGKAIVDSELTNLHLIGDSEEKKKEREMVKRAIKINPLVFSEAIIEKLFLVENRQYFQHEIEVIQHNAKKIKPDTVINYLDAMKKRRNTLPNLISIPTHFIASVNDTTISYESIEEQIVGENIQLTTLFNSGHMSFIEEKEVVINSIKSFLYLSGCEKEI